MGLRAGAVVMLVACASAIVSAQTPELKFIADTLVVQADGTYEADPDLATMTFRIFSQEKELKKAYEAATQSMQRISALATNNGLKKEDVSTGVLTVAPVYEGDRKKRARSYYVQGELVLRVHDFSHIGPILDGSVEDGIADFRSLTYSLSDEEAAKKLAVAEAMRRAIGRASVALEQKGQKLGGLRYMSLDVQHLLGVAQLQNLPIMTSEAVEVSAGGGGGFFSKKAALPPPPPPQPQKITVRASVQCAFQIQ
ncbi:MAG: SIMPL domain-containing protein [Acidobacteriia bacterium]|nr:SIMPL domain-containing protein [Terriglobia bacterium]